MKVRAVKKEDFDDIFKLQLQLEDAESVFDDNLKYHSYDTRKGKIKLRKRIVNPNNIFLVAENENKKIIGFIDGFVPEDEWWYNEKVAYISHICVDINYRNQGIGTNLMKKFEKKAMKNNIIGLRLLAFPNNKPAITLYKNCGFEEYSTYYYKKFNR